MTRPILNRFDSARDQHLDSLPEEPEETRADEYVDDCTDYEPNEQMERKEE